MSLPHALLGLINYQPKTGYELKATFDQSIHFFWNATLPQIYRTLNQMEKKGWLTLSVEHQNGKPSRKVYQITKSGKEEFKRWLAEPPEMAEIRNPILIKIFFGHHMNSLQFAALLQAWQEAQAGLMKKYEQDVPQVIARYAQATRAFEDAPYWSLTLDYGKKIIQMGIDWCDEALKQIEAMEKKKHVQKKPSPLLRKGERDEQRQPDDLRQRRKAYGKSRSLRKS